MFAPGILQLPLAVAVLVEKFSSLIGWSQSPEEQSSLDNASSETEKYEPASLQVASASKPKTKEKSKTKRESGTFELFELIRKQEWTPVLADQLKNLVDAGVDINLQNPNEFNHPLLVYALLHSRFDWIVTLLAAGADVERADWILMSHYNRTACDFVWEKKNIDVARQLIQTDGAFPTEFGSEFTFVEKVLAKRLGLFVKSGEKLHKNIERNCLKKIEKFVVKNPKVKIVYNCRNECALTTALKQRKFEIYWFLRSRGFTNGIDSGHDDAMRSLKRTEVQELETCAKRYFKSSNSYVYDLVSQSRVECNNDEEDIGTVRKYFETLNKIPEMLPILKIAANQAGCTFVFNFDRNSAGNWEKQRRQGKSGSIVIHASSEIESENLEILARELTRHVLALMFDNEGLPFCNDDEKPRKYFEKAIESFRESFSENEVVKATDFEKNLPNDLIIPQLMTFYVRHPERFAEIRESSKEISEFYDAWVQPELTNEISAIEPRRKVQQLNKFLSLFHQLKATKLNCVSHKHEFRQIFDVSDHISIFSQTPEIVLTSFIRNSAGNNEIDATHIFITIEQLMDVKNFEMIHEALESELCLTLVVLDSNTVDIDTVTQILKGLLEVAQKIVFATSRQHLTLEDWTTKSFEIDFKFKDLDERSQDAVLKTKINFQGVEVALHEILDCQSKLLQDLPLENVSTLGNSNSIVEFKETLPAVSEVYVERTFETSVNSLRTSENVIALVESGDTMLINGAAGMGKTTSAVDFAKAFKQSNRLSWVAYIDWKQQSQVFDVNQKVCTEFISEQILDLKNSFARKLFQNFYDKAKVIFVVDDITSGSFESKLLKSIQASGNRLLITTTLHSSNKLEEILATESIRLMPFTEECQIEFLSQTWRKTWKKSYSTDFEEKAKTFLNKTRNFSVDNKILEVPLNLSMLVDMIGDCDIKNLTRHSLFAQFINKKVKAVNGVKVNGNVAEHTSAVLKFHQKVAIDECLVRSQAVHMSLEEHSFGGDYVSAGLLKKTKNGKIQFFHQSQAEFFIAKSFFEYSSVESLEEAAVEVLRQILVNENFKAAREFIDDQLQTEPKSFYTEAFEQKLEETLKEPLNQGFLHFLILEQNTNLLSFMLKVSNLGSNTKLELLKHKNNDGNAVLHSAIKVHGMFAKLWAYIEELFDESNLKELLVAKGQHRRDALNQALRRNETFQEPQLRRSNAFLRTLSQKIEERKLDILKLSDKSDVRETAKLVLTICTRLLEPEEYLELLLSVDEHEVSTIHFIFETRSIEVVNEVLNQLSAKLEVNQIEFLLSQKCSTGQTVLHRLCDNKSASTASALWNFVSENLNQDVVASLLFSKAGWEGNAFNLAACNNHPVLSDFLEWLRNKPFKAIEKAFFARNRDSWTFLHLVTWRCSESLTSKVLEVVSESFAGEDIKKLLLAEDRNGMTPQKRSLQNKCKLTTDLIHAVYEKLLDVPSAQGF